MVRLLNRSRMVAIVPSLEGRAPASLTLRVLDRAILWLSDAGEFASRDFSPVPWGEPGPGERGAQASICRMSSRCEAEFGAAAAPSSQARLPAPWLISSTIWRYCARRNGIECRIVRSEER